MSSVYVFASSQFKAWRIHGAGPMSSYGDSILEPLRSWAWWLLTGISDGLLEVQMLVQRGKLWLKIIPGSRDQSEKWRTWSFGHLRVYTDKCKISEAGPWDRGSCKWVSVCSFWELCLPLCREDPVWSAMKQACPWAFAVPVSLFQELGKYGAGLLCRQWTLAFLDHVCGCLTFQKYWAGKGRTETSQVWVFISHYIFKIIANEYILVRLYYTFSRRHWEYA